MYILRSLSSYLLVLGELSLCFYCTLAFQSIPSSINQVRPESGIPQMSFLNYGVFKRSKIYLSSSNADEDETTNYDEEEILMQIHLTALPGVSVDEAKERVSRYMQSFPFAAVLPVQPLQYLPAADGGVNLRFLRKKTKEKGSLDGGMRFFLTEERNGIDLVVKRNSFGQTIPKMFSEKLVVQAFVKGLSGDEPEKTGTPPTDVVRIESVFHKWLQTQ